ERSVEDVADARLAPGSGARIKRHLVRRAVEQVRVRPEYVLRPIAVMDVEVDDGHAFEPMLLARVEGGDGDDIEQAESHGPHLFGVMARRAHAAKGVPHPSR